MKQIVNYISEKLHLNKDTKITDEVSIPSNKEEFKDMINKYFREWWDSDSPNSIKNEKNYKETYDYIMKSTEDKNFYIDWAFNNVLPLKFIKYMNSKYNLGYELK